MGFERNSSSTGAVFRSLWFSPASFFLCTFQATPQGVTCGASELNVPTARTQDPTGGPIMSAYKPAAATFRPGAEDVVCLFSATGRGVLLSVPTAHIWSPRLRSTLMPSHEIVGK